MYSYMYKFKIPRSRGNVDARLTENRNARNKQLLMMPIRSYRVVNFQERF